MREKQIQIAASQLICQKFCDGAKNALPVFIALPRFCAPYRLLLRVPSQGERLPLAQEGPGRWCCGAALPGAGCFGALPLGVTVTRGNLEIRIAVTALCDACCCCRYFVSGYVFQEQQLTPKLEV